MSFRNIHRVDIYTVFEPSLFLQDGHIIAAHHAFAHNARVVKCPILESITSLPLGSVLGILILVPELDGNLVVRKGKKLFAQPILLLSAPLLF